LFPTPVMERWLLNLQPSIPTYEWYSNSNHILHKAIQLNIAAPVNGEMWTLYRLMESECQRPAATPSKSSDNLKPEEKKDLIERLMMQSYDKPNSVLQTLTAVSNQLYPNGEVIVAGILNFNRNTEQKQMMVKSNPLLIATHPEYKMAATAEPPFVKRLMDAIKNIKFGNNAEKKSALLGIKYNSTSPSNSDEGSDWLMLRIYSANNDKQQIVELIKTQGDGDALVTLINDELKKLGYTVRTKQTDLRMPINKGIGNAIILNQKRRRSVAWAILFPLEDKLDV